MPPSKRYRLLDLEWPTFGGAELPPPAAVGEYRARIGEVRWSSRRGVPLLLDPGRVVALEA